MSKSCRTSSGAWAGNRKVKTMNQMTPVEIQALLRWDVYAFAQKCFYELNPEEAFQSNGHLEVLAATLEEVWCCGRMKIDQFMKVVPNEN